MQDIFSIIGVVVPELMEVLAQRYAILNELAQQDEPIGRKNLARQTYMTERTLRTAISNLREYKVVTVSHQGIELTDFGHEVLLSLEGAVEATNHLYELEQSVKECLSLTHCWVIPGELSKNPHVYHLLAQAVEEILMRHLDNGPQTIAVTGGTTLAEMSQYLTADLTVDRELTFVPARGGVTGAYNIQSNNIIGLMAQRTQGISAPMYIPETMTEEMASAVASDPKIQRIVAMSQSADTLLISVGTAEVMAQRLELSKEQNEHIQSQQAVGEAMGVFFDSQGHEVLRLPRVGISIEDLERIPLLITVVAGASKAQAVTAYYKLVRHQGWLVCDEDLARAILSNNSEEANKLS